MATGKRRRRRGKGVGSFFRPIIEANPALLERGGNAELRRMWLEAHPSQKDVSKTVLQGLANLKTKMRHEMAGTAHGKKKAAIKTEMVAVGRSRTLDKLEEAIDDCVILAAHLDRNGLESVIRHLRKARTEVTLKIG
jgi:hypothetical protein